MSDLLSTNIYGDLHTIGTCKSKTYGCNPVLHLTTNGTDFPDTFVTGNPTPHVCFELTRNFYSHVTIENNINIDAKYYLVLPPANSLPVGTRLKVSQTNYTDWLTVMICGYTVDGALGSFEKFRYNGSSTETEDSVLMYPKHSVAELIVNYFPSVGKRLWHAVRYDVIAASPSGA